MNVNEAFYVGLAFSAFLWLWGYFDYKRDDEPELVLPDWIKLLYAKRGRTVYLSGTLAQTMAYVVCLFSMEHLGLKEVRSYKDEIFIPITLLALVIAYRSLRKQ